MKTKTQHTPTPWEARKFDDTKSTTLYSNGGTASLGAIKSPEDAAFIVRAVNSHEALLIALRETSNYYHDRSDHEGFLNNCEVPICRDNVRIIKQAEGGK